MHGKVNVSPVSQLKLQTKEFDTSIMLNLPLCHLTVSEFVEDELQSDPSGRTRAISHLNLLRLPTWHTGLNTGYGIIRVCQKYASITLS